MTRLASGQVWKTRDGQTATILGDEEHPEYLTTDIRHFLYDARQSADVFYVFDEDLPHRNDLVELVKGCGE